MSSKCNVFIFSMDEDQGCMGVVEIVTAEGKRYFKHEYIMSCRVFCEDIQQKKQEIQRQVWKPLNALKPLSQRRLPRTQRVRIFFFF